MKRFFLIPLLVFVSCINKNKPVDYVNVFIGTGVHGHTFPGATLPFGMIQASPDTRANWGGYAYKDTVITGFSHTHISGVGCSDLLDIMFMPTCGEIKYFEGKCFRGQQGINSKYSHEQEKAYPGYYFVKLLRYNVDVELTTTRRCAVHRYQFPKDSAANIFIDLVHGPCPGGCSIIPEEQHDTVTKSYLQIIDDRHIRGYKISTGWADDQRVYFYAELSKPMDSSYLWVDDAPVAASEASGLNIKSCISLNPNAESVEIKIAISPVSMEGAKANFDAEVKNKDFESVRKEAAEIWNKQLSKIEIADIAREDQKKIFYSALYHSMLCLYLFQDIDGKYLGPDGAIHQANGWENMLGFAGFWDVYRAALPLQIILNPEVSSNLINSMQAFYNERGLLPVMPLMGNETMAMLGYHSMPVIADAYAKGIRGFDEQKIFDAMKESAMSDSFGVWMQQWQGIWNYKNLGFVPCDKEYSSVSKTLEYAYDDWCVAEMAKMLGKKEDHQYFLSRSMNYKNVYDSTTRFMRPRKADGSWFFPFDPWEAGHHRGNYAEGTAWQWSFFVQHDVPGLIKLMGGKEAFTAKLDSLFTVSSELKGNIYKGDIAGLIGQYAHGNEPSHHIAYMYNYAGSPWKTQEKINQILQTQYSSNEEGISGDDDTGQMSAWYVFSALGFYPVTPGSTVYAIGAPQFEKMIIHLNDNKKFKIQAMDISNNNKYIQSAILNGTPYTSCFFNHNDLMNGGELVFEMGPKPSEWGKE